MKRLLSILLVVCLVCTLLYVPAGAIVDDHTPPVVTGVYMNSPGATVTVGETLHFSVAVEDESGIDYAHLEFVYICDQGHRHTISKYVYAYQEYYNESTGILNCEISISDSVLNGTYKLSSIRIYDNKSNSSYYYPPDPEYGDQGNPGNIDFDSLSFTVTGSTTIEDHTPPTILSVSMDEPGKIVATGDTLHFQISTEDESGIDYAHLEFVYVCDQGHRHTISKYVYAYQEYYNEKSSFAYGVWYQANLCCTMPMPLRWVPESPRPAMLPYQ